MNKILNIINTVFIVSFVIFVFIKSKRTYYENKKLTNVKITVFKKNNKQYDTTLNANLPITTYLVKDRLYWYTHSSEDKKLIDSNVVRFKQYD